MDTFNEVAAWIAEYLVGSRLAPDPEPESSRHLHWNATARVWSDEPGKTSAAP